MALDQCEPAVASVGGAPAIRAEGLSKRYRKGVTTGWTRYRSLREDVAQSVTRLWRRSGASGDDTRGSSFWALRDVSFEIAPGERVGIIGRNGAGKTTLLRILAQITPPSAGRAELRGRVGALLEVGTGFHPELTGRDNIFLSAAILGTPRAEIKRRLDGIVEFAGIGDFLDTPVKRYSMGMYLRLAFAVAAHLEPDILLVDEVLAVGDAEFQRKCLARMAEISQGGRTVVYVSHNMASVMRLCDRILLLDRGGLVADGPAADVVRTYLQSGFGSAAERRWERPEDAPGDGVARLRSVRVLQDGVVAHEVDIRRQVEVEVEYWHLVPNAVPTFVTLQFMTANGTCLFATSDASSRRHRARAGVERSICEVPGNLLAEGEVLVHVLVWSVDATLPHAQEREAVSFIVVDRDGPSDATRGRWPGVMRPLLTWRAGSGER